MTTVENEKRAASEDLDDIPHTCGAGDAHCPRCKLDETILEAAVRPRQRRESDTQQDIY